jgi:Flp pilus assembly pilin Flp
VNRRGLRTEQPIRQAGRPPRLAEGSCAHVRPSRRGLSSLVLRLSDRGATAVEYALIVSLIAAVIFGTVFALGQVVLTLFKAPLGGF